MGLVNDKEDGPSKKPFAVRGRGKARRTVPLSGEVRGVAERGSDQTRMKEDANQTLTRRNALERQGFGAAQRLSSGRTFISKNYQFKDK